MPYNKTSDILDVYPYFINRRKIASSSQFIC